MSIQHTIEATAGGATILAIAGSIAQVAPMPEGLTLLGSLAQVGAAGLVLYTVRIFLADRKERDAAISQERREWRDDYAALVARVEEMQRLTRSEIITTRAEYVQTITTIANRIESAVDLLRGVKCEQLRRD